MKQYIEEIRHILEQARQKAYSAVNPIWRTVFAKLHWPHYQRVLKITDEKTRAYYIREAASENWSISTLERNINTLYYQHLLSSKEIKPVENEMLA